MSQRVGGMVEEEKTLPPGAYFAQFSGFSRNKEGQVVLKEKTSVWTDKETGLPVSQEVIKLYWQFTVVIGTEAGSEVAGSTPLKGVNIVTTDSGPLPRFKSPGAYAPNFIGWLSACGLDFAKDLAGPIFEIPVTNQTILDALEGILLEKAKGGHIVSLQVVELQEGVSWVSWDGGVMRAPADVASMITPGLERSQAAPPPSSPATPVQAEQQRLAEYVRYLIGVAGKVEAVDVAVLQEGVKTKVKEWGIKLRPNVPLLSLLNTEQLWQVIDQVVAVLLSENVEFEGLAPLVPEPPEEFMDGEIPF